EVDRAEKAEREAREAQHDALRKAEAESQAKKDAQKAREQAQQLANESIDALEKYLKDSPPGKFRPQGLVLVQELRWRQAEERNTIESLKRFLERYPAGPFSAEARLRIMKLEALLGTWQSTLIAKVTLDFKADGTLIQNLVGNTV